MSLANIFYTLGIIYMTLGIVILIVIAILLFYITKKVTHFIAVVEDKVELAKTIVMHPKEIAANMGVAMADTAISKVVEMVKSKKKSNSESKA